MPFREGPALFFTGCPCSKGSPFQAFVNNYKYCNAFPRGLLFWNPFSRMGLPFCKGFPFLKDLPFCKDLPFLTGPFSRSICNVFELIGLKWQMCGILAPAALCSFVGVKNTNLQHFGIQPLWQCSTRSQADATKTLIWFNFTPHTLTMMSQLKENQQAG